jgi:hypothetical protein
MNKLTMYNDEGDEEVVRGLRAIYAAPIGEPYWNDLEARIMGRIAEVDLGWWAELDRWARPALIAAAVLVLAAGVAMFRAHQVETETAYENILTPSPVPVETVIRPTLEGEREASLRDVVGHKERGNGRP